MTSSNKNNLAIQLSGVSAGYQASPVLNNISLVIEPGDFVGVIGPNGCGKSTLLKVILGLIKPASGQVKLGDMPPEKMRRKVGYLPQLTQIDFNFPASVWDVVMMGRFGLRHGFLDQIRPISEKDKKVTREALDRVGLADLADRPIGQLSGGQRQRAFIARAIAQEPEVLLLDEPITGVDITSQHALLHLLEELNSRGITIISTTHDLNCVASSFNRVVCLNHKLIAEGPPNQVLTQEILNETYGSHLLVMTERGPHIEHNLSLHQP